MMNHIMRTVLWLSIAGSLFILAIMLCKPFIRHKLSKRWQYYIWLAVIARLLFPFSLEVNYMGNVYEKIRSMVTIAISQQEAQNARLPEYKIPVYVIDDIYPTTTHTYDQHQNNIVDDVKKSSVMQLLYESYLFFSSNLWLIWLVVALILLIRKITIYQSFIRFLKAGRKEVSDIDLLEELGKIAQQEKVRQPVGLYTNRLISSPLLVGFFKSCIILPATKFSNEDFRNIVLHELTHYKRFDMFYKWIVQLTICLHWFNPFVYFMEREINRACELSCDEVVIAKLNIQEQKSYGDTLLNTLAVGHYNRSIASLSLNEGSAFIKERLDLIMNFKKQTRFGSFISIALTVILCFGAGATGTYAATTAPNIQGATASLPEPTASAAKPPSTPSTENLTLVEKEYTLDELKLLNVSGIIVEVSSENVLITRGGETLKFQYYMRGSSDYTLQKFSDGGGTRENLCLLRESPLGTDETARSISISIPDKANLKTTKVVTTSGNITIENCTATFFLGAETRSGQVFINGGSTTGFFKLETENGNALVMGTELGGGPYNNYFGTQTGVISFQPKDSVQDYSFIVDTETDGQIIVNGKKYEGGAYTVNDKGIKPVYFDSQRGSLIVQDLSLGKLSLAKSTPQSDKVLSTQTKPVNIDGLTLTKKEYTASELQSVDITGLRVNAATDDVVLSQGGTSLVLQYYQAYVDEYTMQTKEYQLYEDGYGPPSQGNMPGTIKQLVFTHSSNAAPGDARRTIYITLPADLKLNRVVKVITESGNITADKCSSTAMLDLITQTGNIKANQCSSPFVGAETQTGKIDLSNLQTEDLGMKTVSGTATLQLADRAENYQMSIDTNRDVQITVNEKIYSGGKFILNQNAYNKISFDSKNGTLTIKEIAIVDPPDTLFSVKIINNSHIN